MIDRRIAQDDYKIKLLVKHLEDTLHDVKTLASIVYLMIQDLETASGLDPLLRMDVKTIRKHCCKVVNMLSQVNNSESTLSDSFKPYLNNYNVVGLIEDIVQAAVCLAMRKNVSITFDTPVEEKIMALDKDLFERIMLNIISNAIKFTPENGYVDVLLVDNDDEIVIDVIDNGTGFGETETSQIFNRYHTKHTSDNQDGAGIGLSIVKEMVEVLGGHIEAKSCLEHTGAMFSVSFPVSVIPEEDAFSLLDYYQTKIL